ncbi:MAG: phospholipid-binding protein MlaC [Acidobacteriota bacterium]
MLKRRLVPVLALILCLGLAGMARAGAPTDQLKGTIDKIIAVLKEPALKGESQRLERRNKIFNIVEERFDFPEMAKRSVGEYWQKLSEAEQKEFELAFANLLQNSYISKIEKYSDETVNFSNEKSKGDEYFSVHTDIVSGGKAIPVDYSLHEAGGQWLVYDVNIEGVSLVTNYRSQFTETIRKDGFKGLMDKINDKLKKLNES